VLETTGDGIFRRKELGLTDWTSSLRRSAAMMSGMPLPRDLQWLFPEHDCARLDPERDARAILARVLEHGRMEDVRWCVRHYGLDRIHRFFREASHPELTGKTISLWRHALKAKDETWAEPRRSRLRNVAPWPE
jgi:hypothetical protein